MPVFSPARRLLKNVLPLLLTACVSLAARGQDGTTGGQSWSTETLPNGLRVIYATMPSSPAAHVRVIYHVGSRDEKADRQGFAHMFEHMMFRGSLHVAPQEHMKLIGLVGGISNAFTSFDETVYHDTLPSQYTEMALWLEADRMSSFRVSPAIFDIERKVVGQEWRLRLNQPYGGMFDQLMPEVFKKHPYQWTPIGDMADLQQAKSQELQQFFQHYYVPNNAILVVAGNIDEAKTKNEVHKYFGWIEARGRLADTTDPQAAISGIQRDIPQEPEQTEPRRLEVKMTAPLARVILAYHMPPSASDDLDALGLLLSIVGDGQSSRLSRSMVTTNDPVAVEAESMMESLEDGGVMGVMATVLDGKKPEEAEKLLKQAIADAKAKPVTAEELEKVKQQQRLNLAQRFETAESTATLLGEEMLTHNNLNRVITARARLEAITPADLQRRVAQKYFPDNGANVMVITPGTPDRPPIGAPIPNAAPVEAPTTQPVAALDVKFPADYPVKPPMAGTLPAATFEKGTESTIAVAGATEPVRVVVMEDHRMPIINWTLALRAGGNSDPMGKEGIGSLTADMVRRGPKGKTFDQFNEELESRAISLDISDAGDNTKISGSCLKEQFAFAQAESKAMLAAPAFDEGEFQRLHNQSINSLNLALDNPQTLASRQLTQALYGNSPLGRLTTLTTMTGLTLDDAKKFYASAYHVDGAVLVISGDISVADGQAAAKALLEGLPVGKEPTVDYTLSQPAGPKIYIVDQPQARQSAIQMGVPGYSIQSDEKFIGTLANQILSGGIESRLGKYVRAEKGYVYGVEGIFSPTRHAGAFIGETDTRFETTADTITAMYKVFGDLKNDVVSPAELADAKFRVSGQILMSMQTIGDQAERRLEGILNGYPADYYDKYSSRIAPITADQIKETMNKYVHPDKMIVVVVGQADAVKPQLDKLGAPVEVIQVPKGKE